VPVIPADLKYGQDHMWARPNANGGLVRVGVTDFAQDSLGDVVDVSLPRLGETVDAGRPCGDIESVKSVNDLIAPISGTVRGRNDELADAPELINSDPYGQGWMFEIEADPTALSTQLDALLDAHAYGGLTGA
jgi:glycine cleavage system H protein